MLVWLVMVNLLILVFARSRVPGPAKRHRDVVTTQGVVRGYFAPHPPHFTFLGLPYARPPTRHDRYKASKPPLEWDGIFEATHRVKCPQNKVGEENCLVVNVFTPEHASSLPVVVQVHDGGFQNGWGSYQPPLQLLQKDIIFVSFNYRIGALGFLCLRTPDAPGNAGLKDQVSAIYWVHRNIGKFGGNPLDITLYGIGAGAASIQLLVLSRLTEGLFHKVILESGSALSPASITYDPLSVALDGAVKIGYKSNGDHNKLLEFYNKSTAKQLSNISSSFLPCVENIYYYSNNLLDNDPMEILLQGNFQKVPIIIVYTDSGILIGGEHKLEEVPERFEDLLPNNLEFASGKTMEQIAGFVKEFYFDNDNNVVQNYAMYINDLILDYPIVKSAFLYASKSSKPVFLMKFARKSKDTVQENKDTILDYLTKDNTGVYDEETAEIMLTLWSNFIKLGDPTPLTTGLVPIIWQPVISGDPDDNTDIGTVSQLIYDNTLRMREPVSSQRLVFWDRIYNKFYKSHSVPDFM